MRLILAVLFLILSAPALAYIGPGAGVSFLGSIWALLAGVVLAIGAILFWPIRYMIRRAKRSRTDSTSSNNPQS